MGSTTRLSEWDASVLPVGSGVISGVMPVAFCRKKKKMEELGTVHEYIVELHSSFDFILNDIELRREARNNEMESLANAKAVLFGAKV